MAFRSGVNNLPCERPASRNQRGVARGDQVIKTIRSPAFEPHSTKYAVRAALTSRRTRSTPSTPGLSCKCVLTMTSELGLANASRLISTRYLTASRWFIKYRIVNNVSLPQLKRR